METVPVVSALGVEVEVSVPDVALGIVTARNVRTGASTEPLDEAVRAALKAEAEQADDPETTRKVRDLLRHGKYKPTGRGKPASEYLHKAACEDRFPRLHPLVDINNVVSLGSRLPISLIDLVRAETDRFILRRGRPDERYVFNSVGQEIALEDLLLVARLPGDIPCANPVKDSMDTKLSDQPKDVLAVVYGPADLPDRLRIATERFVELVRACVEVDEVGANVYAGRMR